MMMHYSCRFKHSQNTVQHQELPANDLGNIVDAHAVLFLRKEIHVYPQHPKK
jgi:hypothetical protein